MSKEKAVISFEELCRNCRYNEEPICTHDDNEALATDKKVCPLWADLPKFPVVESGRG